MSVEIVLEALVDNLFVVNGRAVRAAPPGALIQQAPRRSPRARSQDLFFALLDIDQARHAPASLYEQLVRLAADTYFQTSGTITSGLREAIEAVNEALLAFNRESGAVHQAHLACAALRSGEIYLARVGACQAFLQQSGDLIPFPADPADLKSTPLGLRTGPPVSLNRLTVASGDTLILADQSIHDLDRARRDQAMQAASPPDIVNLLRPLVEDSAAVMVIQMLAPEHMTPEPDEAKTVETDKEKPGLSVPQVDVGTGARKAGSFLALGVAGVTGAVSRLLDVFFPEPGPEDQDEESGETASPRISTTLAAGLTVLIAFIVTVLVVGLMLRNYGRDRCDDFVAAAEQDAESARSLVGHRQEAREAWAAVKLRMEQALEVCPPSDPRPLQALEEARGFIDEYDQVVRPRPSVTLMRRFPTDAVLHGPVLHSPDIYVLDTANVALYRDQIAEGDFQLADPDSDPVLSKGDTIDGYVVERIVDIEWMTEGSTRTRNMLVSLEPTRGVMLAYSPSLPTTATPLMGWEEWVDPVAISTWGGNFYILDPGADQIWRYRISPSTGDYTEPPESYFATLATNPDLEGAIDMSIDDQGNIYLLFDNGTLAKYFGGEPVDFSLDTLPVALKDVQDMHLDSTAFAQALYLVDTGNESIFETTLSGNFAYHYKAANEDAFDKLWGMTVKPSTNHVYVAANNGLYHFVKSGVAP